MCLKLATSPDGSKWPCGQCHNCRINRKRDWQARLLLEAAVSAYSMFVTLTIEVPDAKDSTYCTYLDKPTVQRFLKRLRKAVSPVKVRYLVVGEYGEKRGRAHYHALVFLSAPVAAAVVSDAWGLGHCHFGDIQQESIDYCLAYVLKKPGHGDELPQLEFLRRSRHPEFRLHSQGLGGAAVNHLLVTDRETGELQLNREFRVLGRRWPVGRYFRDKFRGGLSKTSLHDAGVSDPVLASEEERIERLLNAELRALPVGSAAYTELREKIQARRDAQVKRLKGRRIADYYRDLHHLNDRGRKNETF